MKAIQVIARGHAEIVDIPKPEMRPGHVLVRTSLLSLCGSDVQMLHFAADESYPFPPGTTGHEMVGVVEAIDADGSDIAVGDEVLALAPGHRAMAEYYLAPVEHVLPLPAGVLLEQLLQAQQFGTVLYASQRLPNIIGKSVVVIGQGSAGLWFNYQLKRMGALQVIALDLEPFRLELSERYGATHTVCNSLHDPMEAIRKITGGELAEVVVEAAGEVESINLAIDLVCKGGDILYFGYPRAQTFAFNFDRLFLKCCRATTIVGAAVEENQTSTRIALDLIASGEAEVAPLITHRFAFADVLDAYEMLRTRQDGAVKIVIEMPA
ncbi:MAG: zinc-binding dehydrogenase [Planctomycetes bacterium]|nr:zinc-binding dehydrogenase [Planctomycetota bacterium]